MKYNGIAIIVKSKTEYEKVQYYFGKDVFYIDWNENMLHTETAMVIKVVNNCNYSVGGVGCAVYMRENNIQTLPFIEEFGKYLLPFNGKWDYRL